MEDLKKIKDAGYLYVVLKNGKKLFVDLGILHDGEDFESLQEYTVTEKEVTGLLSLIKSTIDDFGLPPIGSYFLHDNCWKIYEYTFFSNTITIGLHE